MFSAGKGNSTHTWARSKRIEKSDPCMLKVCAAAAILARGLDRGRGGGGRSPPFCLTKGGSQESVYRYIRTWTRKEISRLLPPKTPNLSNVILVS